MLFKTTVQQTVVTCMVCVTELNRRGMVNIRDV